MSLPFRSPRISIMAIRIRRLVVCGFAYPHGALGLGLGLGLGLRYYLHRSGKCISVYHQYHGITIIINGAIQSYVFPMANRRLENLDKETKREKWQRKVQPTDIRYGVNAEVSEVAMGEDGGPDGRVGAEACDLNYNQL
jgi:hypothetical protein